jgi:hypothetical protein
VAVCVTVALVAPATAEAASISATASGDGTGRFTVSMTGTSDPCVDSPPGSCFGMFLTAYKTTPGAPCPLSEANNSLIAFRELSDAGGPFSQSATLVVPYGQSVQVCALIEHWRYDGSGDQIAASTSLVVSNLPPPPAKTSAVKTRALDVKRRLTVSIGCSLKCDVSANLLLLRPGGDLRFGSEPAIVKNVGVDRVALIWVTLSGGQLARLAKQWRPSELRVFGTSTFLDGSTRDFTRDVQFRRPPRRHGGGDGRCEPGYSPCLPIVGDLDCDDIPEGKKPVRVTGSDRYRLDADNDGIGCES